MISGIVLGTMTYASMVITYMKLPRLIRRFILSWKLLSDLAAGILVYILLGAISKTVAAIVGAITASLLVGLSLEVASGMSTNGRAKRTTR